MINLLIEAVEDTVKAMVQNAAGSEELAASTEEIQVQSSNLLQVVVFFHLKKPT